MKGLKRYRLPARDLGFSVHAAFFVMTFIIILAVGGVFAHSFMGRTERELTAIDRLHSDKPKVEVSAPATAEVAPPAASVEVPVQPAPAPPQPSQSEKTAPAPTVAQRWKPAVGQTWQYQLEGAVDTTVEAAVFDIDGFEAPPEVVKTLKNKKRKLICYISAGTWENWRPDASKFPVPLRGQNVDDWVGEKWLDIRQVSALRPIMAARFDMCKQKGYDAVEPDNVDGFANSSGFGLTAAHQLAYNRMLAELAHERGLAVALKNDVDQIPDLVGVFDFAINEQCFQYNECGTLASATKPATGYGLFIKAGKPVFQVEYSGETATFCAKAKTLKFGSMKKRLALTAWREPCK